MTDTTQAALVLAYFRRGKTLTQNEAQKLFGVGRLAHIRWLLIKWGHNIQSRRKRVKTAHGHYANVSEYWLDLKRPLLNKTDRRADRT